MWQIIVNYSYLNKMMNDQEVKMPYKLLFLSKIGFFFFSNGNEITATGLQFAWNWQVKIYELQNFFLLEDLLKYEVSKAIKKETSK